MEQLERKYREQRHNLFISAPRYPMPINYYQYNMNVHCRGMRRSEPSGAESSASVDVLLGNLSLRASLQSDVLAAEYNAFCELDCPNVKPHRLHLNEHLVNNYENFPPNHLPKEIIKAQVDNVGQENALALKPTGQENGNDYEAKVKSTEDCEVELPRAKEVRLPGWNPHEVERPIENEEWVAFLQRSMEELMDGEV